MIRVGDREAFCNSWAIKVPSSEGTVSKVVGVGRRTTLDVVNWRYPAAT